MTETLDKWCVAPPSPYPLLIAMDMAKHNGDVTSAKTGPYGDDKKPVVAASPKANGKVGGALRALLRRRPSSPFRQQKSRPAKQLHHQSNIGECLEAASSEQMQLYCSNMHGVVVDSRLSLRSQNYFIHCIVILQSYCSHLVVISQSSCSHIAVNLQSSCHHVCNPRRRSCVCCMFP